MRTIAFYCAIFFCMSSTSAADNAIQRGAHVFMTYCSGCHTLQYMRYDRLNADLGLSLQGVGLMNQLGMQKEEAQRWFGRMPPDLSLTARERGRAFLHDYLAGFYTDATRPFGTNNTVVLNTAMPNVLMNEQSRMTDEEFDGVLEDLVVFLEYVAEPAVRVRYRIGLIVIGFLSVLWGLLYQLNQSYWHISRTKQKHVVK